MPLVLNGRSLARPITGVERYSRALLQAIASVWPNTRVVVPRSAGAVDSCGLEVVRCGLGNGHAWEQGALPSALRPDDLLLSPANTGPLRVRRQALVVHDLAFLHRPHELDRRVVAWYGFLLPRLARRCAALVTVSQAMAGEIHATLDVPAERIHVVPPFQTQWAMPTTPPLAMHRPYVLVVGAHSPRKGADRIVRWYAQLEQPFFDVVLVGRRDRVFVRPTHGIAPGVQVREQVSDGELHQLYTNALALLHMSTYEGFGLPVLEALTFGCPVIAYEAPAVREHFGDAVRYGDVDRPGEVLALLQQVAGPERAALVARGRSAGARFHRARTEQALRAALDPLLS